jgi:pyruvate dehydrogenase (quinone)
MQGDPKYEASQDLPDYPYARYAEGAGLAGIRVDRPEQVGPAWDAALAADRPTVLDIYTDPDVPPLPPHVSFKQARAYAESVLKGDPDASGSVRASLKELFA